MKSVLLAGRKGVGGDGRLIHGTTSKVPEGGLQLWMNVWDKDCVCVWAGGSGNEENL